MNDARDAFSLSQTRQRRLNFERGMISQFGRRSAFPDSYFSSEFKKCRTCIHIFENRNLKGKRKAGKRVSVDKFLFVLEGGFLISTHFMSLR